MRLELAARPTCEEANRSRWRGQPHHMEIWQLSLSDPRSRTSFWIRYSLHAGPDGGLSTARLWFSSYVLDGRGGEVARYVEQPLFLRIADQEVFALELAEGRLTSQRAVGRLDTPEGEVSWDLSWSSQEPPFSLLPWPLLGVAERLGRGAFVAAPAALFSGTVRIGPRHCELSPAHGTQSHQFGRRAWERWVHFRCSSFDDAPDAWIEGLAFPLATRPGFLATCSRAEVCSTVLRWNGRRVSLEDPLSLVGSLARPTPAGLLLHLEGARLRIRGLVRTAPDDFVLLGHQGARGKGSLLHTEVGQAELRVEERSLLDRRWRETGRLLADHRFQWEYSGSWTDPRVGRKMLP